MRVLISGSSGFVGSALLQKLSAAGHDCIRFVRSRTQAAEIDGVDAIVHLAGENIAGGRWTAAKKSRISNSRVQGTTALAETVAKLTQPPRVFVSASAVGFYGDRGDEILNEQSSAGHGFLAEVCKQWESSTAAAAAKGIRVVQMRIGVVIGPNGGALSKMLLPFKLGVGGKVGSGNQYMSWIELEDLCSAFLHAIQTETLTGPVNAVAPSPVTNLEFTKTLGRVLSRPTIFPLPAFAARLAFGEMADALLLSSARVEPVKLLKSGFTFKHRTLESALRSALLH